MKEKGENIRGKEAKQQKEGGKEMIVVEERKWEAETEREERENGWRGRKPYPVKNVKSCWSSGLSL